MSCTDSSARLFDMACSEVRKWDSSLQESHGFGLILGDPQQVHRRRMLHARTMLAGEAELQRLSASHPAVLMKGLEVAQLYPMPIQRPFRDLDLLVRNARDVWQRYVDFGYRRNPNRRVDIDHHHLPALATPSGAVGIEFHLRPNVPAWARIPTEMIFATAEPSRTGVAGLQRPRDDLHALLLALHCWKGGFGRLRDLLDALLLSNASEVPVEETAAQLGLAGLWRWTLRFADDRLFGHGSSASRASATSRHAR